MPTGFTASVSRSSRGRGDNAAVSLLPTKGASMERQHPDPRNIRSMNRRELLKTGLAAGAALSFWPLYRSSALWAEEAGTPKRGGTLHVRGRDPVHFDPHLSINV